MTLIHFENGQISQHRPQKVMQKDYHVNEAFPFENGQVSQPRPSSPTQNPVYESNIAISINVTPTVCV